jgi:phage-related protein
MKANDFLQCEFNNDSTKYIAEITHVNSNSFDCRFLNSGDIYTFDSNTMKVTSQFGAIPMGSQLADYTLFTASSTQSFNTGDYVAVTFADGSRFLGEITGTDGGLYVTFLDSGFKYVFDSDNKIISTDNSNQTQDASSIDSYLADAPVIVVSAADAGSGTALHDKATINRYTPQNTDTIIVNTQEFSSGIGNFKNWSTNAALHNTSAKTVRAASAIKFIALHETSGDDGGTGFDPPFTSHFVIAANEVRQFNDLCEIEWHVGIFNDASIGIEFKNPDWVRSKIAGYDYIDANWSGDYPSYTLPSTDKLENLVALVQRLISKNEARFPAVDPTWLQIVSYNDVRNVWDFTDSDIPADDKKDLKKLFIYSNATDYIKPENFDESVSGIFSHNSVSNLIIVGGKTVIDEEAHTDGSFQALYTWLRIMQSYEMNDAFTNAKDLVTNNVVRASTGQQYEGYHIQTGTSNYVPYSGLSNRKIFLIDIETML